MRRGSGSPPTERKRTFSHVHSPVSSFAVTTAIIALQVTDKRSGITGGRGGRGGTFLDFTFLQVSSGLGLQRGTIQ